MKILNTFILLLCCTGAFAQEDAPDYNRFDALAKKINDIQRTADGKLFNGVNGETTIGLTEVNFLFNYHDMSATWISKVSNKIETMENLDLAEITACSFPDETFGEVGAFALVLPQNIKYNVIKDGKMESMEAEGIPFFFNPSDNRNRQQLMDALCELVFLTKVRKGKLTTEQAKHQMDRWKKTVATNTASAYHEFWKNEPNSLFNGMAYYKLTKLDRTVKIDNINTGNFYFKMTENKISDIINTRTSNFKTEDKLLKKIQQKYRFKYENNTSEGIFVSNTRPAYYSFEDFLKEKHLDKNLDNIQEMMNVITISENNELLDCFPKGYRMGLFTHFFDPNNPRKEQIEFWIESDNKSPIDFYKIANLLKQKYGSDQNNIKQVENRLSILLEGLGEKYLIFRNTLGSNKKNPPYRAYIIIAYNR